MNVILSKVFFPEHPKAGEETHFKESVINGTKKHSCRGNANYWQEHLSSAQKAGRDVSIRQWEGKPYRSKQGTILDVPAKLCDIQRVSIAVSSPTPRLLQDRDKKAIFWEGLTFTGWLNSKEQIDLNEVAKNDGLTPEDFAAFIFPVFKQRQSRYLTFAIIHFTTFRY